ncbi:hypothetical protein JCM33374_g3562 [Metschnikowia sp. JCM 33374]|nr:hypothetical protein JCM33374_g3562 [Metschnikowia sp. JCM 33374]
MSDGASYSEQLLESARRNNTELFTQISQDLGSDHAKLAQLINSTKEVISHNSPLHLATDKGNWEFLDMVLDVEGVEIDPQNREGDTPLHLAVKYAAHDPEYGYFIIDNLIDAGSDVRVVDKHGLKPVNYVGDNEKLRALLESAEYASGAGHESIDHEDDSDGESDATASESEQD